MERPYEFSPPSERPYRLPEGDSLAVWVVLNVEHVPADRPYWREDGRPDSKELGRRDYGNRAGYWRLLDVLDARDAPATLALNAAVCDRAPAVVEAARERGWAIMGHGVTNAERLVEMDREAERRAIERTRERISAAASAPAGWLSPGLLESAATPELLAEAGFSYVCDWCADDQPFALSVGDLVSVPYSLDLNDKRLLERQGLTGPAYRDALVDAADRLRAEDGGRVLPIPLHPYVAGQPFRADYLGAALDEIAAHGDVRLTTGDEIAAHYRREHC